MVGKADAPISTMVGYGTVHSHQDVTMVSTSSFERSWKRPYLLFPPSVVVRLLSAAQAVYTASPSCSTVPVWIDRHLGARRTITRPANNKVKIKQTRHTGSLKARLYSLSFCLRWPPVNRWRGMDLFLRLPGLLVLVLGSDVGIEI